ncbi:hypothetical protein K2X30_12540 [bacterium]|nr:hypothetical protein [bacterium]
MKQLIFFVVGLLMVSQTFGETEKVFDYVITETSGPTSFDPLDADSTNNLPVARMIYATPLEISHENQLSSRVLESFKYDSANKTAKWVVKKDLKFDDGSPMTAQDVAFAVSRMAFTRPKFPVIDTIEGIKPWLDGKEALKSFPKGIKVDGQTITIQFAKNTEHPLFRFSLELFSIIPKKCVDLATNKIVCKEIPASGPYRLTTKDGQYITFEKRDGVDIDGVKVPKQIRFNYISSADVPAKLKTLSQNTVMAGNEQMFPASVMNDMQGQFATKFTPASRFSALLINPHVGPFTDRNCRLYFAKKFRESYKELHGKTQNLEGSIFTKILPGYLSIDDLEAGQKLADSSLEPCKAVFKNATISWGYNEGEKNSTFVETLKKTFEKIGAKAGNPVVAPDRKTLMEYFSDGKVALFSASSGFWALDPVGDMKMLFTPNLHKVLRFASEDPTLQKMIADLEGGKTNFNEVNRYLYGQGVFNVYSHLRRFFASSNKSLLADVPFAITSPAPWQVFKGTL